VLIGIDVSVGVTPPLSGVGYHILRLVEQLAVAAPGDFEFRLFFNGGVKESAKLAKESLPASDRVRSVAVPFVETGLGTAYRAYWNWILPMVIRWYRCAVFHGPAHLLPRLSNVATVLTIHDLAFFDHDLYEREFTQSLREAVKSSMERATAIIALSEHTRQHIQRVCGRTENVEVIYGAGNYATDATRRPQASDRDLLRPAGVAGRYVLYVGDYNPRKNVPYLIEAFGKLRKLGGFDDVQLVLAGNSQKARADLEIRVRDNGLASHDVIFTGRVSDDMLCVLYRNASVFALCSLLEGFTLVTLEAMSYATPVVATDTSSIAEGTGRAAELVPLDDAAAVARALAVAVSPGPRRDEMRRMGLERVQQFSWEAAAEKTLARYASIIRSTAGSRH